MADSLNFSGSLVMKNVGFYFTSNTLHASKK